MVVPRPAPTSRRCQCAAQSGETAHPSNEFWKKWAGFGPARRQPVVECGANSGGLSKLQGKDALSQKENGTAVSPPTISVCAHGPQRRPNLGLAFAIPKEARFFIQRLKMPTKYAYYQCMRAVWSI
jgi:hypothetical protein